MKGTERHLKTSVGFARAARAVWDNAQDSGPARFSGLCCLSVGLQPHVPEVFVKSLEGRPLTYYYYWSTRSWHNQEAATTGY